jgi:hypothetical protein
LSAEVAVEEREIQELLNQQVQVAAAELLTFQQFH